MKKRLPSLSMISALIAEFQNWPICGLFAAASYYAQHSSAMCWITRKGTRIHTPSGDASGWWGIYEVFCADSYGLKAGLLDFVPRGFLDIGANIGSFSLALTERYPGIQGFAFEPGTLAFATLEGNLRDNINARNVTPIRSAVVGTSTTSVQFYERPGHSGESSLLVPEASGNGNAVAATTLQQAIENSTVAIDLVKIDIEGGEYAVFQETPTSVLSSIRTIILEYHKVSGRSHLDLAKKAQEAGFAIVFDQSDGNDGGLLWLAKNDEETSQKENNTLVR